MINNLIKKLFLVKEIRKKTGELHFKRWRLLSTPWLSIYIHRIYLPDEDKHLHDHPWSFIGIILSGGYDVIYGSIQDGIELGWQRQSIINFNKSSRFHKILKLHKIPTTTLVITGPRNREWGYLVNNKWMNNKEYRQKKRQKSL